MRRIDWMKNAKRRYRITTDIIVGFPGETEAGFRGDARPARRSPVRFALQLQILAAPQHAGAADGGPIPEEEKQRRLMILQEKQRAIQIRRRNQRHVGQIQEVLVEGRTRLRSQWIGRTSEQDAEFHRSSGGFRRGNIPVVTRRESQLLGGRNGDKRCKEATSSDCRFQISDRKIKRSFESCNVDVNLKSDRGPRWKSK